MAKKKKRRKPRLVHGKHCGCLKCDPDQVQYFPIDAAAEPK